MKIYAQLAQLQQEVGTIKKDSKGYGYNYASLDHIVEVITPLLKANSLGYTHTFDGSDIICTLFNTEGETLISRLTLPQEALKGMNMSQSMGASITYARRYTLSAILGLVTDEDTDGVVKTPPAKQNVSDEEKKKWFNIETFDGKPIEKHIQQIQKLKEKMNTDQIIQHIEKAGYTVSSKTRKQIEEL